MAKTLGAKAPQSGDAPMNDDTKDGADEASAPETAAAAAPAATVATGFLEPKDVKVGEEYSFYNTQVWSTRCPYSTAEFPAGNFTKEPVKVNEWIKSQVDAGLLRAKA